MLLPFFHGNVSQQTALSVMVLSIGSLYIHSHLAPLTFSRFHRSSLLCTYFLFTLFENFLRCHYFSFDMFLPSLCWFHASILFEAFSHLLLLPSCLQTIFTLRDVWISEVKYYFIIPQITRIFYGRFCLITSFLKPSSYWGWISDINNRIFFTKYLAIYLCYRHI